MGSRWFSTEFGFIENPKTCAAQFVYDKTAKTLTSPKGNKHYVGQFSCPSVAELRIALNNPTAGATSSKCLAGSDTPSQPTKAQAYDIPEPCTQVGPECVALGGLSFQNIVGDALSLHLDPENEGAVFQVASQFNCLEMVGPGSRPEDGLTNYYKDKTQGPVCAMACPGALVYRNYFWNGKGQIGGSHKQINNAAGVAVAVGNDKHDYWIVRNGYLLPTDKTKMKELRGRLEGTNGKMLFERLVANFRVGVHWETETAKPKRGGKGTGHRVCQVYCSAVPVSYVKTTPSADWHPLASAALQAGFEGTLNVAALQARKRQARVKVYLTMLGGGAFGNRSMWVVDALRRALLIHKQQPLDVKLVHFMSIPRGNCRALAKEFE
eukprot:m.63827 g.63827  ORF g.63827 m.63827 type:complete len:380 (+) comp11606_c0_seq5:189-1328(+)